MKKLLLAITVLALLAGLMGCAGTKILHCDKCNKEVKVSTKSNMDEDWMIYCESCEPVISE